MASAGTGTKPVLGRRAFYYSRVTRDSSLAVGTSDVDELLHLTLKSRRLKSGIDSAQTLVSSRRSVLQVMRYNRLRNTICSFENSLVTPFP